ncbi:MULTISPECIES: imidazole glycerol phosphate synthase subunit HisF [Thalassospira]|uniref:Imidazole glycerol phosphate synthase subunit HisF n=2 Tax=Thalassospira tepidiphila TaxID=393657 RepID=A0A853L494_9PROT|nr:MULTISPECIES: imidazole glycerol phosphate synthase cyclase subunit [Thalassospira]MBE72349.1 imidazole glycerol phosphate synthase subunit HisF [Thalassospira sp.]MBO6577950.1 imidazole glycerol phosphate synthase subunit HisF [Thalassospira sp.]MBO6817252.1 imidazole glycerol phosphate synthase subunit HisF [Thalassospira sp.]MBO6890006.1 imidazole glycerol phosphate synthase subunit HisF [Thalassospira sp.]NJB73903.1 cyclase [Thalassospira tepidiphila]|tara:strand:- start:129 stop:899 length:771 start_codon:yes stop_codon:yes gene_type:complete
MISKSKKRLIARLDVKAPNLIKSINLEGLRKLGNPASFAEEYYKQGVDEIIYMDVVASLYQRNGLGDIVRSTTENVFIPITVGGGIRSADDVGEMLRCGADKVAINTAAVRRPDLISELANIYGSQCIVLSVEAKKVGPRTWEAYTDNGREKTGLDVVEWAKKATALGAGEVLITSVDREGTRKGFDIELIQAVSSTVDVPVIASGGMGDTNDMIAAFELGKAEAVAMADVLHYKRMSVEDVRAKALEAGIPVRKI